MLKKTRIGIGIIISTIGFILAVVSVIIETHIHRIIKDEPIETKYKDYSELLFRKSMISSFGEIGIFLGFLIMNLVIVSHLWEQFN